MWTISKPRTLRATHVASDDEYLNDSVNALPKKMAGTPCHIVRSPIGTGRRPAPSASVVAITDSTPRVDSARHIGAIAVLGPPYLGATAGMTCKTRTGSLRLLRGPPPDCRREARYGPDP